MSNTYNNHQYDEAHRQTQGLELSLTLDREDAEALHTLIGIVSFESDNPLTHIWNSLDRFCCGESRYLINEPDDTLKLTELPR